MEVLANEPAIWLSKGPRMLVQTEHHLIQALNDLIGYVQENDDP